MLGANYHLYALWVRRAFLLTTLIFLLVSAVYWRKGFRVALHHNASIRDCYSLLPVALDYAPSMDVYFPDDVSGEKSSRWAEDYRYNCQIYQIGPFWVGRTLGLRYAADYYKPFCEANVEICNFQVRCHEEARHKDGLPKAK